MTMHEILHTIQQKLKTPKEQSNHFGKYKYRSCEDIVEAVKKVLPEGYALTLSDELVMIGDRFYIKAQALLCGDSNQVITYGYARESLDKKGMDVAQITGAASSYARKYALNGLFAIDDTKDADTNEYEEKDEIRDMQVEYKQLKSLMYNTIGSCNDIARIGDIWERVVANKELNDSDKKAMYKEYEKQWNTLAESGGGEANPLLGE